MIKKSLICLLLGVPLTACGSTLDSRCLALARLNFPNTTITVAQPVSAGTFTPPIGDPISGLPAFCRVAAKLKPAPDSNIHIELWMPEQNWNGRFLGTGTGSGGGKINYREVALGLQRGYATANTDMGTSPRADAVVGHPERWADFGYRSTHEMTTVSKKILAEFYGKPESRSYFIGSSTGGGSSLMEAQRYPADYNGIIAGAPANNRTHLLTGRLWNLKVTNLPPDAQLPAEKIAWITKSVIAACAGKDGGSPEDPFLTDPRECKFNPDTLPKCHANDQNDCLTGAQLFALKQIYAGAVNPRTGERIYTPIPVGSENSHAGVLQQENPAKISASLFLWTFGTKFDYTKFDYDHDQDVMDRKLASILNANNPDLSPFEKRGGKLLMYSGTADPEVPYPDALNYYERVIADQQSKLTHPGANPSQQALVQTQNFFRYFLVPGMAHGRVGPGFHDLGQGLQPNGLLESDHDLLTNLLPALVEWVEQGKAPDRFIATTFVDDKPAKGIRFQRPICPYPQFPSYKGGDWKSASSYRCVEHPRGMVLKPAKRYLN